MNPAPANLSRLLAELRAQGWELTPSTAGDTWRAEPPHGGKAVRFSARPNDFVAVCRQLVDAGLRWPPPGQRTEPVVRSVPFAPRPHPEVAVIGIGPEGDVVASPRALALVTPPPAADPDAAFRRLKETREYRVLAASELADAEEAHRLAMALRDGAKAVYDDALAEERRAKAHFDSIFGEAGSR